MKKQLLILITLCITTIGYSQSFTDSNFITYTVTPPSSNTVEVTDYNTANGGTDVDIPATVSNSSITYTVTSIKYLAFQNNGLTSVIIPNSIVSIGTGAFSGNALITATIGNSVTSIGASAFINNQLTSIVIPNNVTTIGNYAFQGNILTSATIGNSVTSIGNWAFQGNALTSVTIPNSVTSIGEITFNGNPLTTVISEGTIPATITSGGSDTFLNLRGNIHLHIPVGTMGAYVTDPGALWTGFNTVTEDALSISDFELANEVKIVTTTEELKIISSGSVQLKNYSIYNITGAKVKEGTGNTIAISYMSNGIYILELTFDQGRLVKKFVK